MSVVSDTSPLNYIVLINLQHILPELFERILIPAAVREELQSAGAPEPIARFMAAAPAWLETRQVSEIDAGSNTWIAGSARPSRSPSRCRPDRF